jgi:hypothetical protein
MTSRLEQAIRHRRLVVMSVGKDAAAGCDIVRTMAGG